MLCSASFHTFFTLITMDRKVKIGIVAGSAALTGVIIALLTTSPVSTPERATEPTHPKLTPTEKKILACSKYNIKAQARIAIAKARLNQEYTAVSPQEIVKMCTEAFTLDDLEV